MGVGWIVVLAVIVLIVMLMMRQAGDRGSRSAPSGAEHVLGERFARGEIDEDEAVGAGPRGAGRWTRATTFRYNTPLGH